MKLFLLAFLSMTSPPDDSLKRILVAIIIQHPFITNYFSLELLV